ncbi:hypothetical protein LMG27952_04562 [Paraburkholderia hiiakae]|uniref:Uncharacterized protein n=1 Tax=Paraburkholderia hiiakae TaxID=1081782 RepID=A0ABN7I5A0_9BURK|nr:DUF2889 domain-containing protein [Paraburkholderia hiiakae]CAD6547365.1 hypothetical protein LMG27952_04562 [Paraburkholderia hiiakae]
MSQNATASAPRKVAHVRQIVCPGYAREDDLYAIEARVTDTKGRDSAFLFKDVATRGAIHDMWLRSMRTS